MKAVVVYESMFGNTEALAEDIGAGLRAHLPTEVIGCADAPSSLGDEVSLLVVGAPTHAFGLPRPSTRRSAQQQSSAGPLTLDFGLAEWLERLVLQRTTPLPVAAFDTKVRKPRLPGSAAAKALRRLRRSGARPLCGARTFSVEGMTGPLTDGEESAAHGWGNDLGASVIAGLDSTPH